MDFSLSDTQVAWRDRVRAFMTDYVYPAADKYKDHVQASSATRWDVPPVVEELKAQAYSEGLWNLFLPPSEHDDDEYFGAGLSNLEYALCAEEMGRVSLASDTGNMEVLYRYGSAEQKAACLRAPMDGEIRSAIFLTEPDVASSDATNIQASIRREGDHYVINGQKWWSSGIGAPRCKLAIVMGKTDPDAATHQQQSQILLPKQSLQDLDDTLTQAIDLRPSRVSLFGYAHMPDMMPRQRRIDGESLPDATLRFEQRRGSSEFSGFYR